MSKVKIYKITVTKGYQMSEQGTHFSLKPWEGNNIDYEGFDDGGNEYNLPEGFELAKTIDGTPSIYKNNNYYSLTKFYNNPMITNGFDTIVLKKSK